MKTVYWTTELLAGNFKRSFLLKAEDQKETNKQINAFTLQELYCSNFSKF